MKAASVVFALCSILAACGPGGRGDDGGGGGGDDDPGRVDAPPGVERRCNQMDIVFVVDDSASMSEEQSNLASNFPRFANVLDTFTASNGDPIDYRVAVTTTGRDVNWTISIGSISLPNNEHGDNGAFRNTCGAPRRWLERGDANLASTLSCRANVGTGGPTFEMPMLVTRMALQDRLIDGTNAGFLRDDALLALVFLTDEDDCSRPDNNFTVSNDHQGCSMMPADLVQFLDTLKGHRSRWAAAVIAGDGNCSSAFGEASNAARLKDFVQQANSGSSTQAVFSSICAGDLTGGLMTALDRFQEACDGIIL
ncbi:MAG: vWA domain-containing protein [Kofleriaceae bacterium]